MTTPTALIGALTGEQNGAVSASSIANLVTLLPKATSFIVGSDSVLAAVGPQQAQTRFVLGALVILATIALALSASLSPGGEFGAKPLRAPVADAATNSPPTRTR